MAGITKGTGITYEEFLPILKARLDKMRDPGEDIDFDKITNDLSEKDGVNIKRKLLLKAFWELVTENDSLSKSIGLTESIVQGNPKTGAPEKKQGMKFVWKI